LLIRDFEERDWPAVKAIFEEGVATRRATFETEAPSWEDWDGAHLPLRLVAEDDGEVVAWAALVPPDCYPAYAFAKRALQATTMAAIDAAARLDRRLDGLGPDHGLRLRGPTNGPQRRFRSAPPPWAVNPAA